MRLIAGLLFIATSLPSVFSEASAGPYNSYRPTKPWA